MLVRRKSRECTEAVLKEHRRAYARVLVKATQSFGIARDANVTNVREVIDCAGAQHLLADHIERAAAPEMTRPPTREAPCRTGSRQPR